jgi:hypothetical protein
LNVQPARWAADTGNLLITSSLLIPSQEAGAGHSAGSDEREFRQIGFTEEFHGRKMALRSIEIVSY